MLTLDSIRKTLPGPPPRTLFDSLDLQLRDGDYVAIMGDSGVGKSTLLNLIAGLESPGSGHIWLDDQDITTLDDDAATRLRRRTMGFVFQAFHILPQLTVAQNVELPLLLLGEPAASARARVQAMLDAVGLGDCGARRPHELSGGETQRVAIARALVHGPRLLLADEPTGNLDQDNAAQILSLLRRVIKQEGQHTMGLLVTHSPHAAATADRILHLTARGLVPQGAASMA